jgi:uncharacterized protein (TIGR02757 family)
MAKSAKPALDQDVDPVLLKAFMDEKSLFYNTPGFIEEDPVSIPHLYSLPADIEIAAFFSALLAWGGRKQIIHSARRLMDMMGSSPHDFVMEAGVKHFAQTEHFIHRTFCGADIQFLSLALRRIYRGHGSLQSFFLQHATTHSLQPAIHVFRAECLRVKHRKRSEKHLADPFRGSAAKRMNLFLRWMVRNDGRGVDFGLWPMIPTSLLSCPLDVHSGRVARKLGLLSRKYDDAIAVEELDKSLRAMDAADPVKYDFALFGLGMYEDF